MMEAMESQERESPMGRSVWGRPEKDMGIVRRTHWDNCRPRDVRKYMWLGYTEEANMVVMRGKSWRNPSTVGYLNFIFP